MPRSPSTPRPRASRAVTPVPTAAVEAVLASRARVVDLRSPGEFAEDHLPGAHNVPLFDDVERAIIGTLYRRDSPESAFVEARRRARGRIRSLVEEVGALAGWSLAEDGLEERLDRMTAGGVEKLEGELVPHPVERVDGDSVVLHCWRGGLRSRSVVAFLHALGLERVVALDGGYKSYRREVVRRLAEARYPETFVLRGLTGVGKTLVLRELERLRPGWTIDLEGLAGHRSSILGMVGLEPCTQKTFESRLAARLDAGLGDRVVFEGESRKVGDVILPEGLWAALSAGTNLLLEAPTEVRVRNLVEDYLETPESRTELAAQLPFIEERLGPRKWAGELTARLADGREDELVAILLERYYDPLYRHSEAKKDYALTVDSSDPARAARAVAEFVQSR